MKHFSLLVAFAAAGMLLSARSAAGALGTRPSTYDNRLQPPALAGSARELAQAGDSAAGPQPVYGGKHTPGCKGFVGQPGEHDCVAPGQVRPTPSPGEVVQNRPPVTTLMACGRPFVCQDPACAALVARALYLKTTIPTEDAACAGLMQKALEVELNHCD
jgi:hypothetical protein